MSLANTIHHSTFIYNQLKKLNLYKFYSNRVINHLMSILISIFLLGYHGKTTDFAKNSSCHRTTIAHFLQREKHIVDSFANGLVRINGIHVEHIQFFHNRIKCIQILGNLEIAVVSTLKTKESYSSYYSHQNKSYPPIQQFFHISFIKMRRKSNSNLGYSARTLLIFNLISSQRSGEIVVPIT